MLRNYGNNRKRTRREERSKARKRKAMLRKNA